MGMINEVIIVSFGLGADYIREKDGIFAILCWLSIVACTFSQSSFTHSLIHSFTHSLS